MSTSDLRKAVASRLPGVSLDDFDWHWEGRRISWRAKLSNKGQEFTVAGETPWIANHYDIPQAPKLIYDKLKKCYYSLLVRPILLPLPRMVLRQIALDKVRLYVDNIAQYNQAEKALLGAGWIKQGIGHPHDDSYFLYIENNTKWVATKWEAEYLLQPENERKF